MKDELAEYDVKVIALSKEDVEVAATHKQRDELAMTLLTDSALKIIRQYGVEHHKAIEVSVGKFNLFGIQLAMVPSIKTMAIPTSLLIDEKGIVRWIDQTDDYRLRSHNERVLQAVKNSFGNPTQNG